MPEKTKVDVLIAGKTYTISGYESDEYIQRVGLYVDRKMGEVLRGNNTLSTSIAAVLTAINIADDYHKARENELEFKKDVITSKHEIDRLLSENTAFEEKNRELAEKNNNMQIEIAKREAELAEIRSNFSAPREKRY
jgi:cell division protein ZapA